MSTARTRLHAHLASWLGEWPVSASGTEWLAASPVVVTTSPARTTPGWDGRILPFVGIRTPIGTVVSVAPDAMDDAEAAVRDGRVAEACFRWCEAPVRFEGDEPGEWVPADRERIPAWLTAFGHEVLVVFDSETGAYAAGVGLKHHDDFVREIAVGTDPAHEGRGLARRLVAQAARRVLADGRVPTYLHGPDNHASARVADAAGFPDRGWRLLVLRDHIA